MNTNALKKFAPAARNRLMDMVGVKLDYVLSADTAELRGKARQLRDLQKQVDATSRKEVVERVAYIWFNRFMALRFMDANGYTDIKVVSPIEGHTLPEVLAEAKRGNIAEELKVDRTRINDLLDGRLSSTDPQTEVFKMLLVAVCNHYYGIMPFMFEPIDDYTELLMPDDLLGEGGILHGFLENMADGDCDDVEIVGWLYQFYMSEKKDEVMARKKAVPKEDIPAVTQLFTPHWIVRYLVENSLGRLWMLNHPDSKLVDRMEYYIAPEEPETDFLKIDSPEEIKVCDPACGSGHMLTYAFDLLYAIYEEQGYSASEIPEKILTNNLFGIEIDERAGELAAFALVMKGRLKYRRFFRKPIQPNICVLESIRFEEGELKNYMDEVGRDLFTIPLQTTILQFEDVDNFGSLIIPDAEDLVDITERLDAKDMRGNLLLHYTHRKVQKVLKMAQYLNPMYSCAIANPPYMGSNFMNGALKRFGAKHYAHAKTDLFSMFIERCGRLVCDKGYTAMVTMEAWMFLSSYEKFRSDFLHRFTLQSLIHMPYEGRGRTSMGIFFGTCCFVAFKLRSVDYKSNYYCLRHNEIDDHGVPLVYPPVNERANKVPFAELATVPGIPISYWAQPGVRRAFSGGSLSEVAESGGRCKTCNDELYLRFVWEVAQEKVGVDRAWCSLFKGGAFRRYYGNREFVINWTTTARDYYSTVGGLTRSEFWSREGVTWTIVTSHAVSSFRIKTSDAQYSSVSPTIFSISPTISASALLGYLNSCVANCFARVLNPTLALNVGDVLNLPLPGGHQWVSVVSANTENAIAIEKEDWDAQETSFDFTANPLVAAWESGDNLHNAWTRWKDICLARVDRIQSIEKANNRHFIEHFALENELSEDVSEALITLARADDRADTQRLVSYAVGCMLGRYSLDKPGLILANQGETLKDYLKQVPHPSFDPDDDNVIPVLDDEYFVDDVVGRFKTFLRVTFGEEHYDKNLAFIEHALGKSIRKYFLNDFYAHHLQMYKKRPIYWLFSSPKKSFNVLIYMHRYRSDTVSRILNEYLREFVEKLKARRTNQEEISISESAKASDRSKATKEVGRIDKILAELDDYERNVLYPLAAKKVEIDLDDGVKVNYNKFGDALRKVPGLSWK